MEVIAHHRIDADVNRKDRRQMLEPLANPIATMLVVLTRIKIDATKERPPHTAGDAMINTDFTAGHDLATSVRGHGVVLR